MTMNDRVFPVAGSSQLGFIDFQVGLITTVGVNKTDSTRLEQAHSKVYLQFADDLYAAVQILLNVR